jgi:hypothetical protein
MGFGLRMYVGEHGDYPLTVHQWSVSIKGTNALRPWGEVLGPYVQPHLLHCTEKEQTQWQVIEGFVSAGAKTNWVHPGFYGYNGYGTARDQPLLNLGLGFASVTPKETVVF